MVVGTAHLHSTNDHARHHLPCVRYYSILCGVHVQGGHPRNASIDHTQFLQPLDSCIQASQFYGSRLVT